MNVTLIILNFRKLFTGICELDKTNNKGPVNQVLSPVRGALGVAAALSFTGAVLILLPLAGITHIAQIAIDDTLTLSTASTEAEIWWTVIISLGGVLLGMALVSAGELVAHLADNRLTQGLRLAVMQRLSQVPLGWFTSRTSGEVKQAVQDDIATLHSLTAHFFTAVARSVGAIVISAIYLFSVDWRMAVITLLPFVGFFIFLRRAMAVSKTNLHEFAARLGRINSSVVEFVNGIPVVKAFGNVGRAHSGYRQSVDAFADAFQGFVRPLVGAMSHAHAMTAQVTVLGVVLLSGALFVYQGWLSPLEILPFVLVAPGICAPLLLLHTLLHDLGGATSAAERVQNLLATPVLSAPAIGQQQVPKHHTVCFENVSYGYGEGHQALTNISFTLKPDSITAVVGSSGSGKSTLARLMLRFFDPLSGRITLGGVDLRQIDTSTLYQHIGFVLQDVRLIHASIRENIALGRPSASAQEIEDAAIIANIHERILALPRGYDSVVGEDADLSGGERQRVSIARAVLLDSPVLVMDEATAAADVENEVAIQNALSRFAQGRTLMVIAHQLDTVMNADHILVLNDGLLVEQGTHEQLLALHGRYEQLWLDGNYASQDEVRGTAREQQEMPLC